MSETGVPIRNSSGTLVQRLKQGHVDWTFEQIHDPRPIVFVVLRLSMRLNRRIIGVSFDQTEHRAGWGESGPIEIVPSTTGFPASISYHAAQDGLHRRFLTALWKESNKN
jgi:hypothetical protein